MKIPAHLRSIGKTYALRSWVTQRHFPIEKYYEAIDGIRRYTKALQDPDDDSEPGSEAVAAALAKMIADAGVLATYIIDKNKQANTSSEEWELIYLTAAYIIVDRYEKAVGSGEWVPS